jgi:N-acyl-D-aspartate/D-glutamate deacylase
MLRILRAATVDNAVAFGLSADRGTVEVGKRSDLLLLRADPLKTITAYDTIDYDLPEWRSHRTRLSSAAERAGCLLSWGEYTYRNGPINNGPVVVVSCSRTLAPT